MRSDYPLYIIAVACFALAIYFGASWQHEQYVWMYMTVMIILGLIFAGLGYLQRPKIGTAQFKPTQIITPEHTTMSLPTTIEAKPTMELTQVKGIGPKRAEQLKTLGIHSPHDLAASSAEDLAAKTKVSPKITSKWIKEAKKLLEKNS